MYRENRPLSTVGWLGDTSLRIVVVVIALLVGRLIQIHQSPLFIRRGGLSFPSAPLFHRREVDRLEQLLAQKQHLYVTGSAGVGKTEAVREAIMQFSNSSNSQSKKVVLCYVDLIPLALSLRADAPQEVTNAAIKRYLIAQVNEYEMELMRVAHSVSTSNWLTAFLARHWLGLWSMSSFENAAAFSTLPPLHTLAPDTHGFAEILNHVSSASERFNGLFGDTAVAPVLVLDGTHALLDPNLAALSSEIVQLLSLHLPLKRAAKLALVLISADNGDANLRLSDLKQATGMLHHEIVGDLEQKEAREFLLFLNAQYHARDMARATGVGSSTDTPGEVMDEEIAAATLQLQTLSSRLHARVSNEKDFDAIYTRYGGYIPDLMRFARTQHDTPGEDVQISDRSKIHFLAQSLEASIPQIKVDARFLLNLYRTLLELGKSPRSAVLLSELVDIIEIPEAEILALARLGLVEVRESNPELLDYSALKSATEAYVCGVSPLSRYSMAKVVKKLR